MGTAVVTARSEGYGVRRRVTVTSIGSACPDRAASIALGLGVPVQTMMAALYRAPIVLVDGLGAEIADRMAALLREVGCDAQVEDQSAPAPAAGPLFDVALHLTDTRRHAAVAKALGAFLGVDAAAAAALIAKPPGIVLGKVSGATVNALRARLGDGAHLVASDPDNATYDLFLGECDPAARRRLLDHLRRTGHVPLAERGCILTGLDRAAADAVWAGYQRMAELRVVNRDFLRFDLVLTDGAPTPEACAALTSVAGIPETVLPSLFAELPITVVEALPNAGLADAMAALSAAGLAVRADLVTILHLGLEVTSAQSRSRLARTLAALGAEGERLSSRPLPIRLPLVLPELQARLLRDALAAEGIGALLYDPAEAA